MRPKKLHPVTSVAISNYKGKQKMKNFACNKWKGNGWITIKHG